MYANHMDSHYAHNLFDRRPITQSKAPAVKWFKEWVPQDVVATGGKCYVLKWVNEATLKEMKEKTKKPQQLEPEPDPTTEVLFLCSYDGCGKTFFDTGALRKHSHIHGERQYVCHYENCGKKFLDSSKLKRHFLIHTGERDFVCPHEGCGKAFSLDFNLRSHMKTHSQENYHICPYSECGKRYAHEYKLKNHIASHHEKGVMETTTKYTPLVEKQVKAPKALSTSGPVSAERPYRCPYKGCEKTYIHEYKLNLHLRREHNEDHGQTKIAQANNGNEVDEGSDMDAGKRGKKKSRAKPSIKWPPAKTTKRKSGSSAPLANISKKAWLPSREEVFEDEDSEETEEERDNNVGDGWRYAGENNEDDDEETEYED